MIISLITSLTRVTLFWYLLGLLVLFIGNPDWAQERYARLMQYPGVPHLAMHGLGTAAEVQLHLTLFWSVPVLVVWAVSLAVGFAITEVRLRRTKRQQDAALTPRGEFCGVKVAGFSLGALPVATTPSIAEAAPAVFASPGKAPKGTMWVDATGPLGEALKLLTPAEQQLAKELLQLLFAHPDHFAGLGHGVGLLEHTLNVTEEAALRCTPEFRLPLLAALAHDIGKLVTFQPDGEGGWVRRGLHSRESARILATFQGFQQLPEIHQRALLLAVKYDHAPNQMPALRGERDASQLALRIINALAQADRKATADEKDRNLEKLKPEDLLWQDFVDFLREAPVVQRGKKGVVNQVNNPVNSPFLYIYEAAWRDAAVRRLPPEVAAALDLTRRDPGKIAKYTRILAERLRKDGLLLEEHKVTREGKEEVLRASEANPLWDVQSGTADNAPVMRGVLVLHAEPLWKALNFRLATKSPFPVTILAPNADADGNVNAAPAPNREAPKVPDVSDGLKVEDAANPEMSAALGLAEEGEGKGAVRRRARGAFRAPEPSVQDDRQLGLLPAGAPPAAPAAAAAATGTLPVDDAAPVEAPHAEPAGTEDDVAAQEAAEAAAAAETAEAPSAPTEESSASTDSALALLAGLGALTRDDDAPAAAPAETVEQVAREHGDAAPQAVAPTASPSPEADRKPAPPAQPTAVAALAPALSISERRAGIAIADAQAVAAWPHLHEGDKYYTERSSDVKEGLRQAGSRYEAGKPASAPAGRDGTSAPERKVVRADPLGLTEGGPRRGKRRVS